MLYGQGLSYDLSEKQYLINLIRRLQGKYIGKRNKKEECTYEAG